jgi:hypothetical protein
VPVKNIELAIREDAAPVEVEHTPQGAVRVWVSMNTTSGEIESACNSAGLAPHHVNLATALWSNNNFDRHFSNEGNEELGDVLVRLPEEQ